MYTTIIIQTNFCRSTLLILANTLYINFTTFRYGESWGPWHGKMGGKLHQFEFDNTYIKTVEVYHGDFINAIKFVMTDNSTFGPFGRIYGMCQVASYHSAEHGFLSFIKGSSGHLLDRIELYFEGML